MPKNQVRAILKASGMPALHQAGNPAAAVKLRSTGLDPGLRSNASESLDEPFIPHARVVRLAPHADFQLCVLREVEGLLWYVRDGTLN